MMENEKHSNEKLLPIISITLFFACWFANFSYAETFSGITKFFLGNFIWENSKPENTIASIIGFLCLILMLIPWRDKSPEKWGSIIILNALLFIFCNTTFPDVANHDIILVSISVGIFIIVGNNLLTKQFTQSIINIDFLPLLRSFLIILYFFGTFHKINSDFLTTEVGCWVPFYETIFIFSPVADNLKIGLYLAGYGTIIVEGIAMVLLLFPRTKYYGMLIGIPFHFMIGIATAGTVAHFSALALALHFAFLSPEAITYFQNSKFWQVLNKTDKGVYYLRGYLILFLFTCIVLSHTYSPEKYTSLEELHRPLHLMWWFYSIPLITFIVLCGHAYNKNCTTKNLFISRVWLANIVPLLLIFHSLTSYIGLRSNADLAMFSNLRTEWGASNHYIIQKPWYLFPYLTKDNYVRVVDSSFRGIKKNSLVENTYENISSLRVLHHKWPTNKLTGEANWTKYIDHQGQEHYFDGTQIHSPLYKTPGWLEKYYLYYTPYVDLTPTPCSSR